MQTATDPWAVVSHLPAGGGDDPWAVVAHAPIAQAPNPYQQAAQRIPVGTGTSMGPAEKSYAQTHPDPGQSWWHRFATAVGIPTSQGEATTTMQNMLTPQADPAETDKLLRVEEQLPIVGSDFRARADLTKEGGHPTALIPFLGPAIAQYTKSATQGDTAGAAGSAVNILGQAAGLKSLVKPKAPTGVTTGLSDVPTRSPAAEVLPKHVEALTGLIEDKGGTVDPHVTASDALPHLRETAVRMKLDPSTLKGREAGQATLKVAEKAVKDVQDEFNTIRKPYNAVLMDQKPIADAYRAAITPELLANEPKVAAALERQAKKFEQPAPLEQINQFRTRMNNQLNAFEQRGTTAQIMSDIETKASKAAANAARDVEYSTVGRLSGIDPEYVRELKQREGALIEAKSSLTKEYNRASGSQGEAVSEGIREKLTNTFPSKHGAAKSVLKNVFGAKPIDTLNNRIQQMFADMGAASDLPSYEQVQPPAAPQPVEGGSGGPVPSGEARGIKPPQQRTFLRTTKADVKDYYNYRFDQLREEAKAAKTPEAKADVQRRMTELDQTQRQHPTNEGVPAMQAPAAPVVENGEITQAHVDAENAFYTQARAELGANADAMAVLRRAQELKLAHKAAGAPPPVTPVKPTLTQKMAAQPLPTLRKSTASALQQPAGESRQAQVTSTMLLLKQGLITPKDADSRIQRLVGPGGRRTIRRPAVSE